MIFRTCTIIPNRRLLPAVLVLLFSINASFAQSLPDTCRITAQHVGPRFAIKTNVLYTATTLTPNIALEIGITPQSTLELSGAYSQRGRTATPSEHHKQQIHLLLRTEYRKWLCESYSDHFVGAHLLYSRYNISGHRIPLIFKKEHRYDGHALGLGAVYGYNWAFAKRWGVEFNIGAGYLYMKYDKFSCAKCDTNKASGKKHYFGPTRVGVALVFLLK